MDTGNTYRCCISANFFKRLPEESQQLDSSRANHKVPMATSGSFLKTLGECENPLKLKFDDLSEPLDLRPVVVSDLHHDIILSYKYLSHHGISIDPARHALQLQGRWIPFSLAGHGPDGATNLYTEKRIKIPPRSVAHISVKVTSGTPSGVIDLMGDCAVIMGSPRFMETTNCVPWRAAINRMTPDGRCKVGLINPSDETQVVQQGALYGVAMPTRESAEVPHPSVCVLDGSQPPVQKTHHSLYDPKADPSRKKAAVDPKIDPAILEGPTTRANAEARIRLIYDKLRLSQCDALVTAEDRKKAVRLILKHFQLFSWDGSYGSTDLVQHHIKLKPDAQPVRDRYRPINPRLEESLRAQLDDWLEKGVVEPSQSEWNSALVPVLKASGAIRWCLDFRKLNSITERDMFPVGDTLNNLNRLKGSSIFSVVDGQGAFHQIPMEESSKEYTSFSTPYGSYQFCALPFGLTNAPATYARLVQLALRDIPWSIALPYLDDTLVHSSNLDEHIDNLDLVLGAFQTANLKLGPEKCDLFRRSVKYLGHIVSSRGQQILPSYAQAVQRWPLPTTRKAVRIFLGKTSYYRRFIKNYQAIAAPLTEMLATAKGDAAKFGDNQKFPITDQFRFAFESLKQALLKAPILAFPDFDSPEMFILDTDYSVETGTMGAVLSQRQEGKERPLIYGSIKLTPAQRNFSAFKGELLTALTFITKFKWYLLARRFVLRTDCKGLLGIHKMDFPSGVEARWYATIANYDFKIIHRAGKDHGNADSLSRLEHASVDDDPESQEDRALVGAVGLQQPESVPGEPPPAWDNAERLKEEQLNDPDLELVRRCLNGEVEAEGEEIRMGSKDAQLYARLRPNLFIDSQGLIRWNKPQPSDRRPIPESSVILLPKSMWTRALEHFHQACGHRGRDETVRRAQRYFFFFNMAKEARQIIQCCVVCQRRAGPKRPQRGSYFPTAAGFAGQKLCVDVVGPLTPSKGYRYILTILDTFTKWLEAHPMRHANAATVCGILNREIFSRYGLPEVIHSDRGTTFTAAETQELAKELGVTWTTTPAYSPKSNMVERHHKTLNQLLVCLTGDYPNKWVDVLPQALYVHHTLRSRTTGLSPFEAMFGRAPAAKLDLLYGLPPREVLLNPHDATIKQRIQAASQYAREKLRLNCERERRAYQGKSVQFSEGQKVRLWISQVPTGQSKKFALQWTGPWTVVKRLNPVLYEIAPSPSWLRKKNEVVTIDRLLPFHTSEFDDVDRLSRPPPAEGELMPPGDEFAENSYLEDEDGEEEVLQPRRVDPIRQLPAAPAQEPPIDNQLPPPPPPLPAPAEPPMLPEAPPEEAAPPAPAGAARAARRAHDWRMLAEGRDFMQRGPPPQGRTRGQTARAQLEHPAEVDREDFLETANDPPAEPTSGSSGSFRSFASDSEDEGEVDFLALLSGVEEPPRKRARQSNSPDGCAATEWKFHI